MTDSMIDCIDCINWWGDWLIDWMIDWLINWMIDIKIDFKIDWLIAWLVDWFQNGKVRWGCGIGLIDWLIDGVIDFKIGRSDMDAGRTDPENAPGMHDEKKVGFDDWLIDWLIDRLIDWLVDWFQNGKVRQGCGMDRPWDSYWYAWWGDRWLIG